MKLRYNVVFNELGIAGSLGTLALLCGESKEGKERNRAFSSCTQLLPSLVLTVCKGTNCCLVAESGQTQNIIR